MKRYNPAFKGWESCMDGFSSGESKNPVPTLPFTPECDGAVDILWSSSSDEDNAKEKTKRKKVVTRLNFDECISHSSGHATPLYSRHREEREAVEESFNQSLRKNLYDSFSTPKNETSLLPADVNMPSSPVIMRRKRRRSLNDVPVSPVIERKFMKKFKKVSPGAVNSPCDFVKYRLESKFSLDNSLSCSSIDMMTPMKEGENLQPTSITPALESMNLNSFKIQSKNTMVTGGKRPITSYIRESPIIEAGPSQDIFENTGTDEPDCITECNDSQAEQRLAAEDDGLPLSAVITMSASPSVPADAAPESGDDNLNPSFALPPLSGVTPRKEALASVEDPESGGKKRRLKKGGLATRLQRLLNREQSWQRMWQHEQMGKSSSSNETCLVLSVISFWTEASKILVQCKVDSKPKLSKGQCVTEYAVLLMDSLTIGERGIKPGCIIQVHPPWQSLLVNSHTTLLIGANLLKIIPSAVSQNPVKPSEKKVIAKTYTCRCIDGESCIKFDKECPFKLELGGLEFISKIMPCLIKDSSRNGDGDHEDPPLLLTQLPPPRVEHGVHFGSEHKRLGTISQVVAAHSQRDGNAVCGLPLIAIVQRVFCYRGAQQSSVSAKRSLSLTKSVTKRWCALLQDAAGEFCEVEFECQPETLSLDQSDSRGDICEGPWWGITYVGPLLCEGALLCINGLRILKRTEGNRPRGLSAVINAINKEKKAISMEEEVDGCGEGILCGQLFIYTFANQKGGYLERLNESAFPFPTWSHPLVHTLYDVLLEWKRKNAVSKSNEGSRVTILVKVLFAQTSGQDSPHRLFVSDPSLSALNCAEEIPPLWIPVSVKPTCYVSPLLSSMPFLPFSSASVPVVCLQDAEFYGGELICDRYSRVIVDGGQTMLPSWVATHAEVMTFIRSSPLPRVPPLQLTSMPGEVVSVIGNVVGVDEETAYTWPACTFCGNDHLSKAQNPGSSKQQPVYYCFQCKTSVETPVNKMSLDAYVACNTLSPECCRIKIKMCQKSITDLLPSKEGNTGYELTCILGKLIGPLICVLVSSCKSVQLRQKDDVMFVLEELLCFVNMQ